MNGIASYYESDEIPPAHEINQSEIEMMERVGYTRIENFAASEVIDNQEMTNFIRENIPLEHLENCPSITYHEGLHPESPTILGEFMLSSHEINIWGSCETPPQIQETLSHEIGHNAHINLIETNSELAEEWSALSTKGEIVSQYALEVGLTQPELYELEDFAESYMLYIHFPEYLAFIDPAKYEFMQDKMFEGREYTSPLPPPAVGAA